MAALVLISAASPFLCYFSSLAALGWTGRGLEQVDDQLAGASYMGCLWLKRYYSRFSSGAYSDFLVASSDNRCQVAVPGMARVINARSSDCLAKGTRASILLRPNWFRLALESEQAVAENGFSAVVCHMEFLGQHTSYRFSWRGSDIRVIDTRAPRFRIGDSVYLTLEDAWSIPCTAN